MNGPEHAEAAQWAAGFAAEQGWSKDSPEHQAMMQEAQFHATMALLYATVETREEIGSRGMVAIRMKHEKQWQKVLR